MSYLSRIQDVHYLLNERMLLAVICFLATIKVKVGKRGVEQRLDRFRYLQNFNIPQLRKVKVALLLQSLQVYAHIHDLILNISN